jgi:glycosyltransferase involved in cell wall biosynthesis
VCRTIDSSRCARCFTESPFHLQAAVGPVSSAVAASGLLQRAVATARQRAPSLVQAAARALSTARPLDVTPADIDARLNAARAVFDQVDLFVAPSQSLADEFATLGFDASKIRVSDYGFPGMRMPARTAPGPRLRIGFVGTIVWHKGVHVLLDAVRELSPEQYEVHLHGAFEVAPDYVADLRRHAGGLPVVFHGGFDRARTADVYAGLDVLVVPSIWLENSPLVIHEAFQAGVPVIGSRIGGTADLIADGFNGRLYDPASPAALASILQSLIDDRRVLATWAARLPAVKSIEDDAREWERVYDEAVASTSAAITV